MFFQGLLSSPLPYLLITIIYLIGLIPCALNKLGITKEKTETTIENSQQEEISEDHSCLFVNEYRELSSNLTNEKHSIFVFEAALQPIFRRRAITSFGNISYLPFQTAILKSYFRAVIVSRPPPSV
jgi:hypothetical protein